MINGQSDFLRRFGNVSLIVTKAITFLHCLFTESLIILDIHTVIYFVIHNLFDYVISCTSLVKTSKTTFFACNRNIIE